jgi:hypothetical protein
LRLLGGQCHARPLADQRALFLGERGVDVQHERIDVGIQLGDDKRDVLRHQT